MAPLAFHTWKKLHTVHHTALWICSGAFRMSPVTSLYVNCVETPLYFIREKLSLELYCRILLHPHHPLCIHLLTRTVSAKETNKSVCEKTLPSIKTSIKTINLNHTHKKKACLQKRNGKKKTQYSLILQFWFFIIQIPLRIKIAYLQILTKADFLLKRKWSNCHFYQKYCKYNWKNTLKYL